jgi:hypothetical protein
VAKRKLGILLDKNRAEQNFRRFKEFHEENPHVWMLFERYTFELINSGHSHYSSRTVIDRIRWHIDIDTNGGQFKISNSHSVYYSRLFHIKYPIHADFFSTRKLTTVNKPSLSGDGVIPIHEAENESGLNRQLLDLLGLSPHSTGSLFDNPVNQPVYRAKDHGDD